MEKLTKNSAWIAIQCGDKIAIAKRGPGVNNAGLWNFFGGKIDKGETPLEAAIRELWEEAGIEAEPAYLFHIAKSKTDHIIHLFLYPILEECEFFLNAESSEYKWVTRQELLSMDRSTIHKPTAKFLDEGLI